MVENVALFPFLHKQMAQFESPILRQLSKKPLTLFEALFFGYFINSFFNSSVASFLSFSLDYGSSVFFPH